VALGAALGAVTLVWLGCRNAASVQRAKNSLAPTIIKQPENFARRSFDPAAPPADMPPLAPDEAAECDSSFLSNASVAGELQQNDATHWTVTITRVKMTLQLRVTIWTPVGASPHVIEHEEGHRQISEHYYEMADTVAERIAEGDFAREVAVSGTDLHGELNRVLERMSTEITETYNRKLSPGAAQLRYDAITDHSRNEIAAKVAVAQAIDDVTVAAGRP
jgi:hypothetical protein